MSWLLRNILTVSLLLFALGAFLTELAGALPEGVGAQAAQVSVIAIAAARGLVQAAAELRKSPGGDQ